MKSNTFLQLDKDLLKATIIVNKVDKTTIDIDMQSKVLYTWFLDRFLFWESQHSVFHDNQVDIALMTGVSELSIKRFVKKFSDFGIIEKGVGNGAGGFKNSNNYKVVNIFTTQDYFLGTLDKKTGEIVKSSVTKRGTSQKKPETPVYTPPKKPYTPPTDDDDLDLPF